MATPAPTDAVAVQELRAALWAHGWRPVAVYSRSKRPKGDGWGDRARLDPPEAAASPATDDALNTGELCDHLRPLDMDIEDRELVAQIAALAVEKLGRTIIRHRANSGRCLMVYRAAEGSPHKRSLTGNLGKIEFLGDGNQFVSHGIHPSGATLEWHPRAPEQVQIGRLPAVTEEQVEEFLLLCAPLIDAQAPSHTNGGGNGNSGLGQRANLIQIAEALSVIPNAGPPDWEEWNRIGMATWGATGGSAGGFDVWCAWSERHPSHDPAEAAERWDNYRRSPPTEIGAGTLFHLANQYRHKLAAAAPVTGHLDPDPPPADATTDYPLDPVCPVSLDGLPIPQREWIIEGVIPAANVTILAGDGGIGKSLLAQQLMTAAATGRQWLGMGVLRCRTIGVFCEDDVRELHARQEAINVSMNCNYTDLTDVTWIPRVGTSNGMVAFGFDGAASRTEFYHAIFAEVQRQGAQLVVLDSLHDLFIGDENRRGQAREFIGALRALILPQRGAVLLCAHPSLSGMQSGSGTAGNTGWNNAVRARHYLTRPEGDGADPNVRIFKTMKSNYGPAGQNIELEWKDGVFVRTDGGGVMGAIEKRSAESTFMLLLDQITEQGRPVSDNRRASNYAPAIFMDMPGRGGARRRDLELAMEVLFSTKRIGRISYGPPSDHTSKLYRMRPDAEISDEE